MLYDHRMLETSNRQLTAKSTARQLDKFYTLPEVANWCVREAVESIGRLEGSVLYVEPSAGDGAFLDAMPSPRIGIDIAPCPNRRDIVAADFLLWRPTQHFDNIIVIGNFPFGKNAATARKFLNHSAGFASYIASILPRTFEKASTRAKIHPGLELLHEAAMSPDSFLHEGQPYSVPVVFQIWHRSAKLRVQETRETKHPDFSFLPSSIGADFAFQRVGARAGKVSLEGLRLSPSSHYFIKARCGHRDTMAILSQIDWNPVKQCTAGNPSIGKSELIAAYCKALQ